MIHTRRTVTIGDVESTIDKDIVLYRGDREVEVEFVLQGNKFEFTNAGNVIKSTNASHGQLVIDTPQGVKLFSEVTPCKEGSVIFVITAEMIDELEEVGLYSFQIRLFDEEQLSRISIPPVNDGIEIRSPLAAEDENNLSDTAVVDKAVVQNRNEVVGPTFDDAGDYNKTQWVKGDVISSGRLNKLEDAIYTIDNNMDEITGYVDTFRESIDTADQTLQDDINRVSNRVEEVNRNLSADVADVNRNWNEVRAEMDAFEDEIWNEVENKIVVTPRFGPSDSVNKEIKNLIENAYSGSTIKFPAGNWVIDESIDIHKPITILGDGIAKTTLNFVNCDGFNTYCSYVDIRDIRIYSTNTTSGEYTGVTINKHESQRVDQNNFKDVDISNFKNGIVTIKHWNFVWDNLNINFCSGVGIRSKGLSVNNMISNSRIVSEDNGDYGILFDDSLGHSEGWNISNSLIYGFYENVAAYQMCHVQLTNSILDFARSKNIVLISRNNNVSGGWLLSNNYMATNGGAANIHDANNVEINNIAFGNTFSNNKIHDYKNGIYGIKIDTNANKNVIFGNRVTNYTNDICNDNANTIIANNLCMSNQDVNIITVDCICTNNVGKVSTDKAHSVLIRNRIYEVFSIPSDASIYSVGDIIIHTSPSDNSSGLYRVVATANGNIIRSIGDHIFKGRVSWSLASSPSEIYVSYPYTLPGAEDTKTILLTCECDEDMSVTVKTGSNTLSGFVIKINKKPTANNAVIHWVAH